MLAAAKIGLKVGPYVAVLLLGIFLGYRFELPRVQTAQLALAHQQTLDAQATAAADAKAAQDVAAATATADAAQAARDKSRVTAASNAGDMRAAIATQAAQPGQDGPVAPVLTDALAAIKAQQGVQP